jgi:aminopeptidase
VDPRDEAWAKLLVERCVDVQPGWQVLVICQPLGRPLYEQVVKHIARRGAYALPRLRFESSGDANFLNEIPEEYLKEFPSILANDYDNADCYIAIVSPENTREGSDVLRERQTLWQAAARVHSEPYLADQKKWVGCYYPTPAQAQDAGMTMREFREFAYGAVLVDWEALGREMERIAEHFDKASTVRIVGDGTDLTFSLEGREGKVDALGANMPGGEFFFSPVEDSADGVITYSEYPASYLGHEVSGIRFEFKDGVIVDASADSDETFLFATLDADEGARRLGEFGVGCNPGIQRHVRNTLYDEKIEGTVHFAIGQSFPQIGGKNTSAIHWDMVKNLRNGGRIELDGKVVQENGKWTV